MFFQSILGDMFEITDITTLKLCLLFQELCSMMVRMLQKFCGVGLILCWTNPTADMNLGLHESLISLLVVVLVTEMLQNTVAAVLTSSTDSAR